MNKKKKPNKNKRNKSVIKTLQRKNTDNVVSTETRVIILCGICGQKGLPLAVIFRGAKLGKIYTRFNVKNH